MAAVRVGEKAFRGIPVSSGVCRGKVFVLDRSHATIARYEVPENELAHEIERLESALVQTRKQILEVQRQVSQALGADQANIFEAHLLVLEDQMLLEEVTRLMQTERVNAEFAYHGVADKFIETLSQVDDEYLRERAKDLRDVTGRVLSNLLGRPPRPRTPKPAGAVHRGERRSHALDDRRGR